MTGAIAQYGAMFDLGVSQSVTRFVALFHARGDRHGERATLGTSLMVLVILGGALLLVPLTFPSFLESVIRTGDEALTQYLFLSSICILIAGLIGKAFAAASFGRGSVLPSGLGIALYTSGVAIGGVAGLLIVQPSLRGFATGSVAGSAVGLLVILVCVVADERAIHVGLPRWSTLSQILPFGLKSQSIAVADIIQLHTGKLVAGIVVGPAAATAYELGNRLALGTRSVGVATCSAMTAKFTRSFAADGRDAIRKQYVELTTKNAAVSVFLPFLLVAVSASAIPFWLGIPHSDVRTATIVLSLTFALNVATGVLTSTVLAINEMGVIVVAAGITTVLVVVLSTFLGHAFGFFGVLVGVAVASASGQIIAVTLIHRVLRIPLRDFFVPVCGPFCIGIVAAAFAAPISFISSPATRGEALVPLCTGAAVFMVVYVLLGSRLKYIPSVMPALAAFRRRVTLRGEGRHRLREQRGSRWRGGVSREMILARDSRDSSRSTASQDPDAFDARREGERNGSGYVTTDLSKLGNE